MYTPNRSAPQQTTATHYDVPDDAHKIAHRHMIRYKELRFIQQRQLLFSLVAFDNYLQKNKNSQLLCCRGDY